MNLSNLPLAEAGGEVTSGVRVGMEDASWETRLHQREEGRGDLRKCPRRMDVQKAKIKSKLRWMEAYKQGSH